MRITLLLIASLLTFVATAQPTDAVRIASYNLRYNTPNDGENAWPNRIEMVKNLIRYHKIELFGTQEGLRGQLNDVAQLPGWAFVGRGRDDGKEAGEHSAIFYKKDRFDLLTTGDFWLSETPDKPGKGWDATCCNRICTWARFRDRQTKKEFYFFSAHFDHQGVEARRQSGRLMVEKIKAIAKNEPVIFVGDLNSTPDTEQVKTIQTLLQDGYHATKQAPYGPVGTFTGFESDAPLKDRIDYIFVSRGIDVLSYAALTDRLNQRFPSDHLPVVADVVINQ